MSLFQRSSGAPEMYQADPLSARINPYCFIAVRITWISGENPKMSKDALSRNRCPIGGRSGSVIDDAKWRAGQT